MVDSKSMATGPAEVSNLNHLGKDCEGPAIHMQSCQMRGEVRASTMDASSKLMGSLQIGGLMLCVYGSNDIALGMFMSWTRKLSHVGWPLPLVTLHGLTLHG